MNKNLFLFAAAAALTFTACSDNDDMTASNGGTLSSNENTAVQFSTYLAGTQTRANGGTAGAIVNGATETNSLGKLGFGVFAYNTGTSTWASATNATPDFMYNQKVTSTDGSIWTYNPLKYWPNDFANDVVDNKQGTNGEENPATGSTAGSKLSFFAYAPYVDAMTYSGTLTDDNGAVHGTGTEKNAVKTSDGTNATTPVAATTGITAMTFNTTTGAPYVRYELASANATENVDLLWGEALYKSYTKADGNLQTLTGNYNVDLTKQSVDQKIGFKFKHALAKLGGNTSTTTSETVTDESKQHVKIILDVDNQDYDKSTAITGGTKHKETLVTVNSIKIRDIQTYLAEEGAKTTTYTTTTTGNLRTKGWFNLSTGEWDEPADGDVQSSSTTVKYDAVIGDGTAQEGKTVTKLNATIAEPTEAPTYNSSNEKPWGIDGVTTQPVGVYSTETGATADNGIFMIPDKKDVQTLVVTVNYTVRTADDHLATPSGEKQGETKINQVITNAVNIPAGALASNKVYTLLIHLGLTSVKFSAQVENWEDATTPDTPSTDPDDPDNNSSENNKDIYLPSNTLYKATTNTAEIEASATSSTVSLTELPDGATVELVSAKYADNSDVYGVTVALGSISSGSATATISNIPTNSETTAKTITVVFKVKNKNGSVIQIVTDTITQKAAE